MVMYAGVDYRAILERAQAEADVIIWDGGNNHFPFFAADLHITVADPLRPGHELRYHPGETNLRMADVVVINKVDRARPDAVQAVQANVAAVNPAATIVRAASPVVLQPGPSLEGARVLVVEDGPTLTHGGMPYGAGVVAARQAGASSFVDPRPHAVGSIADALAAYPGIGLVLPAMGYGERQVQELQAAIEAADRDVVVAGTPIDLGRIVHTRHPIRQARYELRELGSPTLTELLAPLVERCRATAAVGT
jgi:predicted GTPase